MPLDPIVKQLMDLVPADLPRWETLTPDAARARLRDGIIRIGEPERVALVEDRTIAGPGGVIPIRIYTPGTHGPYPAVTYFHGGGWVIGDIDTHEPVCRALANAAACVVISVDYRRAPEHKFPAAAEDAYAVTDYCARHAAEFDVDPMRIAVAGDSSGGNLAAVVALMARDRGGPGLSYQALIYPVTDHNFDRDSYREDASGAFLSTATMRWFWSQYLADQADAADPYASPLRARSLAGLPPALIITAEYDPLRDEGEAYAARLSGAGVTTQLHRYDGMVHWFVSMAMFIPAGKDAIAEVAGALRSAFASTTPATP
ncbi:MAG: alpha/beta hydrolase [Chloroflexota bacterium]|nr:alpha/beta hydrolase [Chloroflexota bacterium]